MDRLGGEHKRGAVLHWLTHFGRGVGRVVIAVLAFILGLLSDVHAIGPSRSCADNVVAPAFMDVVGPSSHVFLAAYRANGPPNSIVILISAATAVEDRSGSSRRYFIAFVCKSGRSARLEDGLYGAYFVPNGTDPSGQFVAQMLLGGLIGGMLGVAEDVYDQWANYRGNNFTINWDRAWTAGAWGAAAGAAGGALYRMGYGGFGKMPLPGFFGQVGKYGILGLTGVAGGSAVVDGTDYILTGNERGYSDKLSVNKLVHTLVDSTLFWLGSRVSAKPPFQTQSKGPGLRCLVESEPPQVTGPRTVVQYFPIEVKTPEGVRLASLQEGLMSDKVGQMPGIVQTMLEGGTIDKIAGYKWNGVYYISEGNHRMASALYLYEKTGMLKFVTDLLNGGFWENAPPQSASYPMTK